MVDSDLEHVPTLIIYKKINQSSYKKYSDLAIMRINIEMILLKKNGALAAAMWLKIVLEDWSTSKPCISVIYRQDLIIQGPTAKSSPGFPQQI